MKKQIGAAIKALRTRKGVTQDELGGALGVDRGNVSRYESGVNAPEIERLAKLADFLGVQLSELISMAETGNFSDGPEIKGTVPLLSGVQAGDWQHVIEHLHPNEAERVPTTYRVRRYTYALRVRGDSMEPKFPDGAILIVEPDCDPEPGSFVVVRQNGGETVFKQLVKDGSTQYLKPLNDRYPVIELKPDAVICGVVKRMEMDV